MRSAKSSAKPAKKSPRKPKQKTITRSELQRLSFANSPDLAAAIELGGKRREWVGIGWIECDELEGDEVLVIEGAQ